MEFNQSRIVLATQSQLKSVPFPKVLFFLASISELLSSHDQFESSTGPVIYAAYFLAIAVAWLLLPSWAHHNAKRSQPDTREKAAHALLKVILPTRSIWPSGYTRAISRAKASVNQSISIPLALILRDVLDGRLEFRNPKRDLQRIIKGEFGVNGWNISFTVDLTIQIKAAQWLILSEFPVLFYVPEVAFNEMKDLMNAYSDVHNKASPQDLVCYRKIDSWTDPPSLCRPSLSPFHDQILRCPDLDYVPRSQLEGFIQFTQKFINSDHHPLASLEFSTCEEPMSMYSRSSTLVALPLLSHTYAPRQKYRLTSTPLMTPLHRILALLTSGHNPLTIMAVQNISAQHAVALDGYADLLETDKKRCAFVQKAGLNGWREERVYSYWRAALFKEEIMTRWVVLLKKRPKTDEQK